MDSNLRRTKFVLFTLLLVVLWNFSSSFVGWGWITATLITFIVILLDVIYIYRYRDTLIARLLLFGIFAGWIELIADRWLVEETGTLVYIRGGPFVLSSPLYMPFAWAAVLVQLGYIGLWLSQRLRLLVASVFTGLIGAINIPLYEEWAKGANWWFYQKTSMFGNTPWYIIGGEFLIASALPVMLHMAKKAKLSWVVMMGILQGLWIWASYALALALIA